MKERSRTEYSMINILVGVIGYIINTILGFVCRIVFVKCLSADYLGVSGLFTNILTMLSLAELGVGSAIVYALYRPLAEHDENKIASLIKLYGKAYRLIGCTVLIIGIILIPFLRIIINQQPDIEESIYLLYGINLFNTVSTYFFSYRGSLLSAAQQNYIVIGINYIITIIQSIFQMIWLVSTHNYLGYLLIQTVGIFIYNISISYIAGVRYPCIKNKNTETLLKEEKREIFKNVRDLMIYKISGLLVNSTDNIIITFFKGLTTTGIASNYTLLINTLNSLLGQIFNSLTGSIGNHNALSEDKSKYEMFSFLNMINYWIFGWASLGIYFCCTDLIAVLFGSKYILTNDISLVLAINFYVSGVTNVVGTYKDTMGLFHYGRFIQVFTAIINIALSIVLGKIWGLFGILLATVIARVCTHLWYTPYVVYKYGFKRNPIEYLWEYIRYLTIVGAAYGVCKLVFGYLSGNLLETLMLKIIFCTVVSNCVYVIFLYRTKEFKKLKSYIKNIVSKAQKEVKI